MRTITVILGRNQTFDKAEAILTKYGATRLEPTDAVMNDESIEAEIAVGDWNAVRAELEANDYDTV